MIDSMSCCQHCGAPGDQFRDAGYVYVARPAHRLSGSITTDEYINQRGLWSDMKRFSARTGGAMPLPHPRRLRWHHPVVRERHRVEEQRRGTRGRRDRRIRRRRTACTQPSRQLVNLAKHANAGRIAGAAACSWFDLDRPDSQRSGLWSHKSVLLDAVS